MHAPPPSHSPRGHAAQVNATEKANDISVKLYSDEGRVAVDCASIGLFDKRVIVKFQVSEMMMHYM